MPVRKGGNFGIWVGIGMGFFDYVFISDIAASGISQRI
jgi:hypothetical protein